MSLNSEFKNWEGLPVTSYDVDQVAFSPDGKMLASYRFNSTESFKLWDVISGEQLYTGNCDDFVNQVGLPRPVRGGLSFTPDGNTLIINGFIFDLTQRNVVDVIRIETPNNDRNRDWWPAAISQDLQIGASIDTLFNHSGWIKLWNTSTLEELHTHCFGEQVNDTYKVRDICVNKFSPNSKIFASLIYIIIDSIDHQPIPHKRFYERIKLWEVETGREIASILLPYVTAETKYKGVLAFRSDSRILTSNCGDTWRGTIVLIDTATGEELCRSEQGRRIVSLAFSPDNLFLASGDCSGEITLWEIKNDSLQRLTINPIKTFASNYKEPVKTLVFSPDGRTLVSGLGSYGSGMTMWDVKTGRILKTFSGHLVSRPKLNSSFRHPDDIVVSPDGNIIANIDDSDHKIKLWDLQTGAYLHCLEDKYIEMRDYFNGYFVKQIAFSQDGNFLIGVFNYHQYSSKKIVIWKVSTGKQIHSINFYKKKNEISLKLNPDGSRLVFFEVPKNLDQPRKMKLMQVPQDYHNNIILVEGSTFIDKLRNFIRRLFNPKSLFISTLWKLSYDRKTLPFQYPREYRYNIIFSPNQQLVAILKTISELEIREVATGKIKRIINIINIEDGQQFPIILFNPDGNILVISIFDKITFWNVYSGEQIHSINSYQTDPVRILAFSPDGTILAFTENSEDSDFHSSIKLWDVEAREEIDNFEVPFNESIMSLNFTGNGQFLISGYSDGTIHVWQRKLQNTNY